MPADPRATTAERPDTDVPEPGMPEPETTSAEDMELAADDAAAGDEAAALRRDLAAQQDRYLRLAAEYDNFRRRTQRERAEAGARAQADLVRSLLDSLDDLDRFATVDPATATAQSVVDAVSMVGRKVAKALTTAGLEVVNPQDAPFDPNLHEAVATAPAASAEEDDTVAQVYQPGYVFGGQLLRPARVVVRQWNG
jgi:molecular chaperone GrpE